MSERTTREWSEWFADEEPDTFALPRVKAHAIAAKLRKLAEIEEALYRMRHACDKAVGRECREIVGPIRRERPASTADLDQRERPERPESMGTFLWHEIPFTDYLNLSQPEPPEPPEVKTLRMKVPESSKFHAVPEPCVSPLPPAKDRIEDLFRAVASIEGILSDVKQRSKETRDTVTKMEAFLKEKFPEPAVKESEYEEYISPWEDE